MGHMKGFLKPIPTSFLQQRRQRQQAGRRMLATAMEHGNLSDRAEEQSSASPVKRSLPKLVCELGEFQKSLSWESALESCPTSPLPGSPKLRSAGVGSPESVKAVAPCAQAPLLHPHAVPSEGPSPQKAVNRPRMSVRTVTSQ